MQKEDYSEIFDWENIFKYSEQFKNQKPFRFTFVENLFKKDFYDKLYETFPPLDDSWIKVSMFNKNYNARLWGEGNSQNEPSAGDDPRYSSEWNKLKRYLESEECISNIRKFTGVPVNKLKFLSLMYNTKGGFQLPHEHSLGDSIVVAMIYFNKGWQKGDPGGTYVCSDLSEDSIIFEPYNLDNSMMIFQDGPQSFHGSRYIKKDVKRRALQIYWDTFESGKWKGQYKEKELLDD